MGLRYDFSIDVKNRKTVYSRILDWAIPGGRALDIGCDTGNLGLMLKNLGMKVDGVEMDPEAASLAAEKLDRVYVGSVEDESVLDSVEGSYDMVIFADVLEHLARPETALASVRRLIGDSGVVVASIPNVANFRVRFGLLFGRFEYTEIGILDRTHLRFYTRGSARRLFEENGFEVLGSKPAATHMPMALLWTFPGLFATRFVFKARLKGRDTVAAD